jgi:hypothetical protein
MTPTTGNAETRPLDDDELDSICGGFTLIELLVRIDQVAIIMGMNVTPPQKVRNP